MEKNAYSFKTCKGANSLTDLSGILWSCQMTSFLILGGWAGPFRLIVARLPGCFWTCYIKFSIKSNGYMTNTF